MPLITYINPKSPKSEAFKIIRTNIEFSKVDRDIRTILVSSPGPGEGKSTVASNLAVTMAQAGKRTLVLDADLRKPRMHRKFNLVNYEGFSNLLANVSPAGRSGDEASGDERLLYEEVLHRHPEIADLSIITSGPKPPNPSEILSSSRARAVLDFLSDEFDVIIIDSPPIGMVSDPAILSALVDGVVLVVDSGKTHIDMALQSRKTLQNAGANILGVILNNAPMDGYYGEYYYYGYAYGEDHHRKAKKRKR